MRCSRVATDNQVTLVGNLTDDPELRFTPNGAAVANFRLAVTPRVREGDNWKDGETSFFRINVWRQMAENVAETMTKGSRCIVVREALGDRGRGGRGGPEPEVRDRQGRARLPRRR